MTSRGPQGQRGYSLVELLVAMMITLIVTGAIYGLLASGNNAFRREPEVADRQQNIRVAMDIISKDVLNAGAGLPAVAQVFTRDDGGTLLNGAGYQGSLGSVAASARGDGSTNSDILEIVGAEERCASMTVCASPAPPPGGAGPFVTMEKLPPCMTDLAIVTDNARFVVQTYTASPAPAPAACPGGNATRNGVANLGAALAPWTWGTAFTSNAVLYAGRVVRYQIALSTDPLDRAPSLWRSPTGRYSAGVVVNNPATGTPGPNWQMVARGIEDLQVEYMDAAGVWTNSPVVATGYPTIVRQVRVTLSARAMAPNLGGTTAGNPTAAPVALRGSLTSVITPRAAITTLQMGGFLQ